MHRQEVETLNKGVVEKGGHLLPAIISTDRTKAHREFMKPLDDAEAVELNEENDDEDSESEDNYDIEDEEDYSNIYLTKIIEDGENYAEDYDSSDSSEGGYGSDFYTEDKKTEIARIVQHNKEWAEKELAKTPWLRK